MFVVKISKWLKETTVLLSVTPEVIVIISVLPHSVMAFMPHYQGSWGNMTITGDRLSSRGIIHV